MTDEMKMKLIQREAFIQGVLFGMTNAEALAKFEHAEAAYLTWMEHRTDGPGLNPAVVRREPDRQEVFSDGQSEAQKRNGGW